MKLRWITSSALSTLLVLSSLSGAASPDKANGPQAPLFELPTIANGTGVYKLSNELGQVTYIDYWASWCGPCRISLPALDSIYREFKDRGLKVVAVSVDVVEEDALDFLKRYQVSYPVLLDTGGATARAYAVGGMPSGYLIDTQGVIRDVHVGFRRGDETAIRQSILRLLGVEDGNDA